MTQQLEKLERELATPAQIWQAQTHIQENQKLEVLQPRLAWKPLNIIKQTLENTSQFGWQSFARGPPHKGRCWDC